MPKNGGPSAKRRAKLEREVEAALLRQRAKQAKRLAEREAGRAKDDARRPTVSRDSDPRL